ncbi:NuA4 histone H4 acetyltransferase complex and the SWR1 complex subunit [Mycoemilia scoparia]|uniref:Protein AF-9 homolog n=1 Tax=Mycoemilia scoparia TaxID=417184 RepID=A0A9W8A1H2_9FUNG|nr:NuA4 histone H4 acetyltransferase complex and the SWR1 complex subunit [Mycoemilia scoparia]
MDVEIKLHETFIDSNRIFKSEPYEVSETGWGEFEVIIKIYFPPFSGEKPISIYHMLKLYPPENLSKNWPKGKAIQNLFYEELIFSDPTEEFYEVLTNGSSTKDVKPEIPLKSTALVPFSIEAEADEAKSLEKAIATMKKKISEYREKMSNVDKQNSILKQEIATLESNLPSKK